ncbi:MAG: hypothetical protein PHV30_09640 [Candidatus Margulisbacteria bacterium]|nr:hypothetical protein [Candidatus Margulisiibacteriota bacterium]
MKLLLKIMIGIIILGLIVLVFVFISPRKELLQTIKNFNALMEIKDIFIKGWEENSPRWEVHARSALMKKQDQIELFDIIDGTVFDNHKKSIIYDIQAKHADVVLSEKNINLTDVTALVKASKFDIKQSIGFFARRVSYTERDKTLYLYDDIRIRQNNILVSATYGLLNCQNQWVKFSNGFNYREKDVAVNGEQLWVDLNKNEISMEGKLRIIKADKFKLNCDNLRREITDDGEIYYLGGNIVIQKEDQVLKGQVGRYLEAEEKLFIDDRVELIISTDNTATVKKNEQKKVLKADHIALDFKNKVIEYSGPIRYTQADLEIVAANGIQDLRNNWITLYGNVRLTQNKRHLQCETVKLYFNTGEVEATGKIFTKITI